MLFICVRSDLHYYVHGVVCCLPSCGLRYRDACQLSQVPLGDVELVHDGALLEHGEELRACACEHSVSRESCSCHASDHRSSGDRPCMLQIPSDVHCRNGLCCSESTLQIKKIADNVFF